MTELVPVLDIGGWDGGDAATRVAIAGQADRACREVGFFELAGHGVPPERAATLREATTEFFDLPLEEKLPFTSPAPDINRGYAAPGTEGLAYSVGMDSPPDLFEAFNVGVERPDLDERVFAPNIWPDRPARLRPAVLDWFAAAQAVAHRLTEILAVALDLPPSFFADKTDRSVDVLRCNSYLRRAGEPDPAEGQMRMGAHTDYGILTVLLADPVPGLQIVGPDGEWHDVVPDEGHLLVNLGDALAVWTNDRWRSTLHRVVPPARSTAGEVRRRSYAFFHDGNLDAVIECLPTCRSADEPPRYPPITLRDHVLGKLLGPRTLTASDAASTVGERASALGRPGGGGA